MISRVLTASSSIDGWLVKRALANECERSVENYVVCSGKQLVVGYYALAAGSLATPGRVGYAGTCRTHCR